MLTLVSAHSPVYSSPDHSTISLMVKFGEFEEELPFNATNFDPHEHGRNLYERALAGEFGEIAPYVAPETQSQPNTTGSQTL